MAAGDTIQSLENQLRNAQKKMENLERKMQEKSEQLRQEKDRDIKELQREMENTLRQREYQQEQEYKKLLQAWESRMRGDLSENVKRLQAEYRQLKENVKAADQELANKSKKLQNHLEEIKKGFAEKEEIECRSAKQSLDGLKKILTETEQLPCERFCPGRLDIIKNLLDNTQKAFNKGSYQLVLGNAAYGTADTKRLRLEVTEKMEEWKFSFHEWRQLLLTFREVLHAEETYAADVLDFPEEIDPQIFQDHDWKADIRYWSRGEFASLERKLSDHEKRVKEIEEVGIDEFLRQKDSLTPEELENRRLELEGLFHKFKTISSYYKNEFNAYWDRIRMGEEIKARLAQKDVTFLAAGFGQSKGLTAKKQQEAYRNAYGIEKAPTAGMETDSGGDYREIYCIDFETPGGNLLAVMIMPQREEDSPAVYNKVRYAVEINGSFGGREYREKVRTILSCTFRESVDEKKGGVKLMCKALEGEEAILDVSAMEDMGQGHAFMPAGTGVNRQLVETIRQVAGNI